MAVRNPKAQNKLNVRACTVAVVPSSPATPVKLRLPLWQGHSFPPSTDRKNLCYTKPANETQTEITYRLRFKCFPAYGTLLSQVSRSLEEQNHRLDHDSRQQQQQRQTKADMESCMNPEPGKENSTKTFTEEKTQILICTLLWKQHV